MVSVEDGNLISMGPSTFADQCRIEAEIDGYVTPLPLNDSYVLIYNKNKDLN